ncbi:hypothetical protein [Planotetraspora sp. GP83]|uniref:hypothetical protein n=1 Tax=Planotetraspora sp. GP83 TaxID=3156264 RepID=UPI0035168348
MIKVREGFSAYETWPFECLRCLCVWEEEYLVRRMSDGHGNDVVVWTREGTQVQPPWSGMTCPACGCGSVTTFPTGYLSHQAAIARARAAATAPLFEAAGRRGHSPAMTYTLLAISLLVVTSVEVYEKVLR